MIRSALLIALLLLAACGGQSRPDTGGRAFERPTLSADAQAILERIDARLRIINDRTRTIDEQLAAEHALLDDCEGWAPSVIGSNSKAENHVLYHLARLRFSWNADQGTDRVLNVLDQLDQAPAPIFRGQSRLLRIRTLLRRGARQQAESGLAALREAVPEMVPRAQALIASHRLVGGTTPAVAGRRMQQAATPAPATAWRAWLFVGTIDTAAQRRIQQYLDACGDGQRLRLSIVCFDESPLGPAQLLNLPRIGLADIHWSGQEADRAATIAAWALAEYGGWLAAPDGTIMLADAPPELAAALAAGRFVR